MEARFSLVGDTKSGKWELIDLILSGKPVGKDYVAPAYNPAYPPKTIQKTVKDDAYSFSFKIAPGDDEGTGTDRVRAGEYSLARTVLACYSLDDVKSRLNITTGKGLFGGYAKELVDMKDPNSSEDLNRLFFVVCTDVHNRTDKSASRQEGEKLAVSCGAVAYIEVSHQNPASLDPLWEKLALAAHYNCIIKGELVFRVESGAKLAAKDMNGKSDPYCKFGLVSSKGKWLDGFSHKTKFIASTLSPTWTDKEHAEHTFQISYCDATKFRVEVWDHDAIGKDDFMGEADISFLSFLSLPQIKGKRLNLKPRAKEKVSGQIHVAWTFKPDVN